MSDSAGARKPNCKLGKGEKLRHRTLVEGLFAEGKSLYEYPLRLTWRILSESQVRNAFRNDLPPRVGKLQMLITVPKKKLRHAVDRVLIRRRIREAYRINRNPLIEVIHHSSGLCVELAFIYLDKQLSDFDTIQLKMCRLLDKMVREVRKADSSLS